MFRPSVATIKKDMRRVSRLILPIAMSCVFIVIRWMLSSSSSSSSSWTSTNSSPVPLHSITSTNYHHEALLVFLIITKFTNWFLDSGNPGWSQEEKDGKLEETFQVKKKLGNLFQNNDNPIDLIKPRLPKSSAWFKERLGGNVEFLWSSSSSIHWIAH